MARARFIRPEFFNDEDVADLPLGAALLFAGIWCQSDLRGVFERSPRVLRSLIFSMRDDISTETVGGWLESIEAASMTVRFDVDGRAWGHVPNWLKHQTVTSREVEIWTKRPAPPGWLDPAAWDKAIATAIKAGRLQNDPRIITEPNRNYTPSPSPSPSPAPTPTRGPARDEHDICAPAAPSPAAGDSDRWGYIRAEPWCKDLIAAGCKVGSQNWPAWKALIGKHEVVRVIEIAAGVIATERWPDQVEEALTKSRGQASIGQAVAHRIRRLEP